MDVAAMFTRWQQAASGIHGQRCRSRTTEPCLLTVREHEASNCKCRGEARVIEQHLNRPPMVSTGAMLVPTHASLYAFGLRVRTIHRTNLARVRLVGQETGSMMPMTQHNSGWNMSIPCDFRAFL